MTLTLEISPEAENQLRANAQERGMEAEELAAHAIQVFISYGAPLEEIIERAERIGRSGTTSINEGTFETSATRALVAAQRQIAQLEDFEWVQANLERIQHLNKQHLQQMESQVPQIPDIAHVVSEITTSLLLVSVLHKPNSAHTYSEVFQRLQETLQLLKVKRNAVVHHWNFETSKGRDYGIKSALSHETLGVTRAQVERIMRQSQPAAVGLIMAAAEKARAAEESAVVDTFDGARFEALAQQDPLAALDYLADTTPQKRALAGLAPLPDDAVKATYEEYHAAKEGINR